MFQLKDRGLNSWLARRRDPMLLPKVLVNCIRQLGRAYNFVT